MELGPNKLPWHAQIATFLVVAVAGFVVFHWYWVVPQLETMTASEQELALKRLDINRALQTASQLREFETEVSELGARLECTLKEVAEIRAAARASSRLAQSTRQRARQFHGTRARATVLRRLKRP